MKFVDPNELLPYSDRKREQYRQERLPNDVMVNIGKMACAGYTYDQIFQEYVRLGITMDQIKSYLIPRDEDPKAPPLRQERANTNYSKLKERLRK